MKRLPTAIVFGAGAVIFAFAVFISASSPFDIEFPIPELENCADKNACKAYCDDLNHKSECISFAKQHGLVNEAEAEQAEKLPETGPGGCEGEEACRAYCEDVSHLEECVAFGEEHDFISAAEAKQARDFAGQTGPGDCRGANECRAYCQAAGHEEECLEFAGRKGLINPQELERARSVVKEGGPGGCRSEEECRAYCQDPAHLNECVDSAVKHGFMTEEEAARVKKTQGQGPGGCRGQGECRSYCEDPGHQAECIDFGEKNGFMTAEEARLARKFAGKTGPGGCRGEQCREFCENPDNAEACLEFAAQEGLMPPQELERARKFVRASKEGGPGGCRGRQCRDFCEDPAHQDECFDFAKKEGLIPPEQEKQFEAGKKIRQKMQESGGPGGCKNDDECRAYCSDPGHVEECVAFGAAHAGLPEGQVREMLKNFTEKRFEARGEFGPPQDFRRFEEESRRRFEEFKQLEHNFRGPGGGFPGGPGFGPPGEGFGPPGGFPGGGPPGGGGFSGPGGCTSPSECIKYCTEHSEECFSFGPPGAPGRRPPEGGIPPGHEFPSLRPDLIRPVPSVSTAGGAASISLELQSAGTYRLMIRDPDGIKEFSLQPAGGSPYSGGLQCPREYINENAVFSKEAFPISAVVTDCRGQKHELAIAAPVDGRARGVGPSATDGEGAGGPAGAPGRFPGQPPGGFRPPEGFRLPEGQHPFPGAPGVFGSGPEPSGSTPPRRPDSCPLMPVIDTCPPGLKKVITHSSPECGEYHACVPESGVPYPTTQDDPAGRCRVQGGTWDGSICQTPNIAVPPPTAPPPTTDPAAACIQAGGTWDGATCRTSPPPPSSRAPFAPWREVANLLEAFLAPLR